MVGRSPKRPWGHDPRALSRPKSEAGLDRARSGGRSPQMSAPDLSRTSVPHHLEADLDRVGRQAGRQQLAEEGAEAPGAEQFGRALDLVSPPPAVLGQQVELVLLEP